jgi:hypothetical protein
MAFIHGKDSYFSLEDSAGTTLRVLTTYLTDVNANFTQAEAETTTKGSTPKSFVQGHTDSTIELSGRYDSTATTGPDAVIYSLYGDTGTCLFEFGPEGGTTGKVKYSGECFLTDYKINTPLADIVGFTATLRVTGAVTRATFS